MTNHVHLLLTPAKADSAALLIKSLGQHYVQYVNREYGRSGTLWEGRFRSCLTQEEAYVLACYRYIELNPVRAAMVKRPQDYRWSSYHANGLGKEDRLITPHEQYRQIARTKDARLEAYRTLFKAHMDPETINEIRKATNGNYALGDARFQKQIEKALGRRAHRRKAGRPRSENVENGKQIELL
jgi:putative transposase